MGNVNWVTWSVFFALLVNVSSAAGLCPVTAPPQEDVCFAQSAIAYTIQQTASPMAAPAVVGTQQLLDFLADPPASAPELQPAPYAATLTPQRSLDFSVAPRHVATAWLDAPTVPLVLATPRPVALDAGRAGPSVDRNRFTLTPNAPPDRA